MTLYQMLSISLILIAGAITMFFFKKERSIQVLIKITVAVFFIACCMRLMGPSSDSPTTDRDIIYLTVSIFKGRFSGIFSKTQSILIIALRWAVAVCFATIITSVFFSGKAIRIYNLFVVPIVILLEVIFFNQLVYSYTGEYVKYLTYHRVQQAIEIVTTACFFFLNLKYELIYAGTHEHIDRNNFFEALAILPLFLIFYMPTSLPYNFFGLYNSAARKFNTIHLVLLGFIFLEIIAAIFILRKRDMRSKKVFLALLSLAAFYQYFSTWFYFGMPLWSYPLHICNTAVILMPIALCFNKKRIFYFTYFVNVVGALFAALMPNADDLYKAVAVEFWYNHAIDIIFPIVAVSLGVFERPKMKNMLQALGIFIIYLIIAQAAGCISNYDLDPMVENWRADYFFIYGDKFTDINFVSNFAWKLKFGHIFKFSMFGHNFYIYWLNTLVIALAFIGFTFVMWYIYDRIYLDAEDIKLISYKTKIKKEKIGHTSRKEIEAIKARMGGKTLIKIEHFSKRYGSSKNYAVKDFSLTVEDGDVFGFIGHNGAGKSTVIKSLVGIQSITEGKIEVCGYDIEKYPLQAKLNIGYVSDNHAVYEKLTGREYINYVADLYQVPKDVRNERIKHYSEMFGLTDALDRESKSYSHGMKQKLVVIASLIHDPKVWVLDEPLTGLDPTSSYQIKEVMKEHAAKGNIVFFSTHVIEVIEKLCTKIAIISHGEMKGVYKIADLKAQGISLEQLYLKYVVSDENRGNFSEKDIATTDAGMILDRENIDQKKIDSLNIQNENTDVVQAK